MNGQKDGEWKGIDKRRGIQFVENYNNGKLIKGTSTDSLNVAYNYDKIIVGPKPRKGLEHFYKYIGNKFRFNKETEGKYGRILLLFYIETDGDASDIKVLKSAGNALDAEAIRLISKYPDWESGTYRGIKSRFSFTIPIVIKSQ